MCAVNNYNETIKTITGCATTTLFLCARVSENNEGMKVEVEEAKMAFGGVILSSFWNISFFDSKFSGVHSWTYIQFFTHSSKFVTPKKKL